jgi:hypothetical protein
MHPKIKGMIQLIISLTLLLAAIWSLFWLFSSASLASEYCKSNFSLFHEQFRCRQPNIAFILCLCSGVASVVFLWLGIKNIASRKNAT